MTTAILSTTSDEDTFSTQVRQSTITTEEFEIVSAFASLSTEDDELRKRILAKVISHVKEELRASTAEEFSSQYMTTMTALALECPFLDVRTAFAPLVQRQRSPLPLLFLDPEEASVGLDSQDAHVHVLFVSAFQQFGFVPNYLRVMATNLSATLAHYDTFLGVLHGEGPLPNTWRHYLVIMAAATERCEYFLRFGFRMFLACGGDAQWLHGGIAAAHPKLQAIARHLDVLAHTPWEYSQDEIAWLTSRRWSQEEIVHAMTITSIVQSTSSFVMGTGVVPDLSLCGEMPGLPCDFEKFYLIAPNDALRYTSFETKRGDEPMKRQYRFLLMSEFSWHIHATAVFQQFLSSTTVRFLDTEFALFEEQNGRSTIFRTLSVYLFDIYGVKCDDFNYHELNKLLQSSMTKEGTISLKSYLKKAGTVAHTVSAEDLSFPDVQMTTKDKIQLALVVQVTRKLLILLYVARALHRA